MINILLPKPRTSKSCTTWFTAAPEDRGTDPLNLRLSKVAEDKHTLGVRVTSSHHVTCFTGKLYHFRGLVPQRPSIASTNIHSLLKVLLLAATRVGTLSASRLLVSTQTASPSPRISLVHTGRIRTCTFRPHPTRSLFPAVDPPAPPALAKQGPLPSPDRSSHPHESPPSSVVGTRLQQYHQNFRE